MTSRRTPLSRRCVQLAGALLALGLLYAGAGGSVGGGLTRPPRDVRAAATDRITDWTPSSTDSGNCLEARADTGCIISRSCVHPEHNEPIIDLRDNAYPGAQIRVRRPDFTRFIEAAKRGEFDHLTGDPS